MHVDVSKAVGLTGLTAGGTGLCVVGDDQHEMTTAGIITYHRGDCQANIRQQVNLPKKLAIGLLTSLSIQTDWLILLTK